MQEAIAAFNGTYRTLQLPDPDAQLMSGIAWERFEHLLTPAFWATRVWMEGETDCASFRLGSTLAEEVAACLLGGYGIPAEVGLAAFDRVQTMMRCRPSCARQPEYLERILSVPLVVGGRAVRYRFPRQKARYLSACLLALDSQSELAEYEDVPLRNALLRLPGIGAKTASWVVRNWRASDQVAIIDVHVLRACRIIGLFPEEFTPSRHYRILEQLFLRFARALNVRASLLDAVMWKTMRSLPASLVTLDQS